MRSMRSIIFNWVFFGTALFFSLSVGAIYFFSSQMIEDFVLEDHRRLLHHVATNINSNLSQHLSALDRFALKLTDKPLSASAMRPLLEDFIAYGNVFTTLHLYKPDGELILNSKRESVQPYKAEQNIIKEGRPEVAEQFQKVVQTGVPILSDLVRTRKNFYYQIYYVPIYDKTKKLKAVLTGGLFPSFTKIDYLLAGMTMSEKNFIALFGRDIGIVAASGQPADSKILQALAADVIGLHGSATNEELKEFAYSDAKENYVVLTEFIPALKYWLTLGVNRQLMFEKQKRILNYVFAILCLSVFFCIFLSIFLGRRLSDPFERLAEAFKQIHLGNFDHSIQYDKNDEIGYLYSLVNKMSEKIKKDQYLGEFWTSDGELDKIKRGDIL
jgi:HAMP domain-containing protein